MRVVGAVPIVMVAGAFAMVACLAFVSGNMYKAACLTGISVVALVALACLAVPPFAHSLSYYCGVFLVAAVIFPLTEVLLVRRRDMWRYAIPDGLGIPMWLPVAWGYTALFIAAIAQWVTGAIAG